MSNFGFARLFISAYDGTDTPQVKVGGSEMAFERVPGSDAMDTFTIRLTTPDHRLLAFPGLPSKQTLGSFLDRIRQYQPKLYDMHGCIVHEGTTHENAWADRGVLELQLDGDVKSLQVVDYSRGRQYRGPRRTHTVAITEESYWLAKGVDSRSILKGHTEFKHLRDLRGHFDLVIGTCGKAAQIDSKRRRYKNDVIVMRSLWDRIQQLRSSAGRKCKILLVFGRETSGLTDAELDLCDHILVIPTPRLFDSSISPSPASASDTPTLSSTLLQNYPSLNLSHAVAVVLYHLSDGMNCLSENQSNFLEEPVSTPTLPPQLREKLMLEFAGLFVRGGALKRKTTKEDLLPANLAGAVDRAFPKSFERVHS